MAAVIPVVGDAGKAVKYGAKAVDKGEAIAKTLNVVRKPLAKNESKQFKATAKGIKKASKGKADKVAEVAKDGKSAVELAKASQGTGRYPGVDNWQPKTFRKGEIIYRGEPNGTDFFTTQESIEAAHANKKLLFEGLQVEPHPILGYRTEMQGYQFNVNIDGAESICLANPDYGLGGLTQNFVPNAKELINQKILIPVDKIALK